MDNTKIDWADMSWNPVTGCLHGCEYCYARRMAERFGGASETHCNESVGTECQWVTEATGRIHELDCPVYDVDRGHNAPCPYEFDPTFYRYRLGEPARKKRPRNIFVCSRADLFGEWVPDEWIQIEPLLNPLVWMVTNRTCERPTRL
jgi:protein gp37